MVLANVAQDGCRQFRNRFSSSDVTVARCPAIPRYVSLAAAARAASHVIPASTAIAS